MASRTLKAVLLGDARGIRRAFDETDASAKKLGGAFTTLQGKLGAVFGVAGLAGGAAMAVKAFADMDTGMREVFTLMPGISAEAMGSMTDDVKAFSREYGLTTTQVIPALYQAISAGVPPENVFTFMETAAKMARGGATDLQTAVDGLSTAVNAYGVEALSAEDASDIMFTGMRLGKTTIGELSGALFQVVPVASAAGVGFDQITAALTAITLQGAPTNVAATNLRGALVELGKEGTIAFLAFEKAAGQTFPEFIDAGGTLQEAFDLMAVAAEADGSAIQNSFGSIEAGMAATVLSSDTGSAQFGSNMDAMAERAGSGETGLAPRGVA